MQHHDDAVLMARIDSTTNTPRKPNVLKVCQEILHSRPDPSRPAVRQVTIRLNDKLVVDDARLENYFNRSGSLPKKGPIQLQTHGGEISWRNIYLKELTPKSD